MLDNKEISDWFRLLQNEICGDIEKIENIKLFAEDLWERKDGGGGCTRIISNGKIIEKGGVNFSAVHGEAPDFLKKQYHDKDSKVNSFFATGVSIVMHPVNPFVPIIHMNVRYIETGNKRWFGGGIDLTPHYIIDKDASYFHKELKKNCDQFSTEFYPAFKILADDYFYLKHRNETRGIGGIFFDHLEEEKNFSFTERFNFVKATGQSFFRIYNELLNRNKNTSYDDRNINWQRLRRGRYVEFNLIHDRGTKFGLDTDGRTESILMSLPPHAIWEYDYKTEKGSMEEYTQANLRKGIDWISK